MGPLQFLFLRITSPSHLSTGPLFRSHIHSLHTTAAHILSESPYATRPNLTPQKYMFFVIATLTVTLTIAASTWFIAVALTSTSDATAMYNCSAFFAYAFSIPLLGERLRLDKLSAVGIAICGVFLMAWATNDDSGSIAAHQRFIGDVVLFCLMYIDLRLLLVEQYYMDYMRSFTKHGRVQNLLSARTVRSSSPMLVPQESVCSHYVLCGSLFRFYI